MCGVGVGAASLAVAVSELKVLRVSATMLGFDMKLPFWSCFQPHVNLTRHFLQWYVIISTPSVGILYISRRTLVVIGTYFEDHSLNSCCCCCCYRSSCHVTTSMWHFGGGCILVQLTQNLCSSSMRKKLCSVLCCVGNFLPPILGLS
jgi:hypothetical protein